ncbi:MAG: excinuclease ABC subunit UvrA [Flavobacteriaceae bacterium]|nr:excinuclease ABC subunit UvrA [Flavobacteriaceae bacterium]MCI5088372.1 excinuclease ABC subunit UvrA [Flavobacteriaceae bacterium]
MSTLPLTTKGLSKIDPKKHIIIKGAKLHNLKNIDVVLPRNKFIVITGLSGSGKSSLAFDTLYAEGQRRYVESLSAYARQFLGKLDKPKVDYIKGIAPAIAIEQKVNTSNPRSTVGTATEIYDYLKLLFARIGRTVSPISGKEVKKHLVKDVIDYVKQFEEKTKLLLLAPIKVPKDKDPLKLAQLFSKQGFARIEVNGSVQRITEELRDLPPAFNLVIDRIVTASDEDFFNRLSAAVEAAFFEGKGVCFIRDLSSNKIMEFSNLFALDGMEFAQPSPHLFSFNNPYGACSVCEGYGDIMGIDPDLVIPNTGLSIYESAIAPWKGESMSQYKDKLIAKAADLDIPIHKPWFELTEKQQDLVWNEKKAFKGIHAFFNLLEEKSYKIQNRVMLSRYRGKTICNSCMGARLKEEAFYVQVGGKNIGELVAMPIDTLAQFFKDLKLTTHERDIAKRILIEINSRLRFLEQVGLSYLSLNRKSNSLSGGESQRINLATSLGSSLVGSMYILDEPSIGLHPKDTENLIGVLKALKDLGNTVIVVEHDEDIMKAADRVYDIGPEAGIHGGQLVAEGTLYEILKTQTLTAQYLNGNLEIPVPKKRRGSEQYVKIKGARANNLKNIDVTIPLGMLSIVTGVSGSGKSTLIKELLYPMVQKSLGGFGLKIGQHSSYEVQHKNLKFVEFIDQNPIGRSSRSNPVTYLKAYDDIRAIFAKEALSKLRGFQPKHFSFNVDGGRCEKCKGEGEITVEMQFMADVHLMCDACEGKRFKKEVLEVKYFGKSIHDVLELTVSQALEFFSSHGDKKLCQKIKALDDVGLGYVSLGQSSSTLSGGEAQRIKLASFLVKGNTKDKTLFIFDEPTTGLHFHDINKLLGAFNALLDKGHSMVVIEHNIDLIKCADHIIDLGPGGGVHGGQVIAQGPPEVLVKDKNSVTASYLKEKL